MRDHILLLTVFASLVLAPSCKQNECTEGTIERDGTCEPATVQTNAGICGPFTELQGDRCVPQFPPTICDPATSTPSIDPETGVTTCVGTGGGGCSAAFACPAPTGANKMTICGQFYDLETNTKFAAADASGAPCGDTPTTTGPCALGITAYDALEFANNPAAAPPRDVGSVYIDDCGRYRVNDIDTNAAGPFIGLGIDDAGQPFGPAGVTVTVGVATPRSDPLVTDFEAWIVKASTTQLWSTSGGPSLAGGIYVATYRAHKLAPGVDRHAPQAGVQFTKNQNPVPAGEDNYFVSTETAHQTIDPAANVSGANGTALVTNRTIGESVVFDGVGGLGTGCRWEQHAAASLAGIVFIQIYRKADLLTTPGSCKD